jgi:glycine C-acetyltransferase
MDGVFLHKAKGGKSWVFQHNDMEKADKMLQFAKRHTEKTGGGILVITEGVFGMAGDLGALDKLVDLKKKYDFRILVDDAHGFGTMGKTGAGVPEHFGVTDEIDLHFGTFAKSMAGIGGFVAGREDVINYLRYNLRSQIFAKSLPMPMVIGALKRLELLKSNPELKDNLWKVVKALQSGLREKGFNIGNTQSPVTPVYFEKAVSENTNEANDVNIATQLTMDLRENYHLFCSIVVYPVIPKGQIMLRLIPTAVHTIEDVEYTIESFGKIKEKLQSGQYDMEQFPSIF